MASKKFALLAGSASLTVASWAHAGGTAIPGYGSQAQPRAGAFVAKADDPSAIFHNPAGLARIVGTVVQLSFNFVDFDQTFQREGTYDQCVAPECPPGGLPYAGQPYPLVENQSNGRIGIGDFSTLPLISVASDLGLDAPVGFAFGLFVPSAGFADRDFAPDYVPERDPSQPPPPGRYDTISQSASVILPSIAAAYAPTPKLRIGARVSWGIAAVQARSTTWGKRNYEEWEGYDSNIELDVADNFVPGFGVGAQYTISDAFELGANYRSGLNVRGKGTLIPTPGSGSLIEGESPLSPKTEPPYICGPGGTAVIVTACLELNQPQIANIGGRYVHRDADGREVGDVELNVQWEDWSAASVSSVLVDVTTPTLPNGLFPSRSRHGFKDVFSFRLGGHYSMDVANSRLEFRGGLAHDTETAPVSWTRLDQDGLPRTTFAAGVAYDVGRYRFELGGGYVYERTRTVDHGGCNPNEMDLGCNGDNMELPWDDRERPDPNQPIVDEPFRAESPFNAGVYKQRYIHLSLGLSARF